MGVRPLRTQPDRRADYRHFDSISTRWMDNDAYLHVNNVVYYSFFDTAVTRLLIQQGGFDFAASPSIALVVETQCRYFSPIAFPDQVHAGLRVGHLGTSSVRYELALFRNDEDVAAAQGHFVHVYVDRATNRPMPIGDSLRRVLSGLQCSVG